MDNDKRYAEGGISTLITNPFRGTEDIEKKYKCREKSDESGNDIPPSRQL